MTYLRLSTLALFLLFLQVPAWGFGNSNSNSGGGSGGSCRGGTTDSSSSASTSNDPPGDPEEEKKAQEKRLAELAELQKKQQTIEKQKRELQAKEKAKEKAQKPKLDNDDDFKIIVPQRVRNEAVHWLAGGGVAPPSLLLRAAMQTLRRRLQTRGETETALSDLAVISRLVQTL